MGKVAIVDSGCANLSSIHKALLRAGIAAFVTSEAKAITGAAGVVFPGVGSFEHAAALLKQKGMDAP